MSFDDIAILTLSEVVVDRMKFDEVSEKSVQLWLCQRQIQMTMRQRLWLNNNGIMKSAMKKKKKKNKKELAAKKKQKKKGKKKKRNKKKKKKNQKSTSCKKKTEKMSRHRYKGLSEKEKK